MTGERNEGDAGPAGEPEQARSRRFSRIRALGRRLVRPPRSRRGLVLLVALVGGIGSLAAIGGLRALEWSETAGFCSQCHVMAPQVKAYEQSAHRDVPCAECHVKPGIDGWVKSKINGARQTLQMITGDYPKPIPTPERGMLPSTEDTCMECHSLDNLSKNGGPMRIALRPRYRADESNTREMVAVVLRPPGLGKEKDVRGPHWHVEEKVEFTSPGEHSRKINWVRVTYEDGSSKQFIARSQVDVSSNARLDVKRLKRTETTHQMDCIQCHNRVGHEVPNPADAIDESISAGRISQALPYIKREGMARINRSYPSEEAADRAIAGLREAYAGRYPLVAKQRRRALDRAIDELQLIYGLVATPSMEVTPRTYPSNLGHKTKTGCFRCHDGAHYRVEDGRVLNETIPSTCTTCHTFPQVGESVSTVSVLGQPEDHESDLWVFDHKLRVSTTDPAGTSCSACHGRTYCENCHDSGAANVTHDEMLYQHPLAIKKGGLEACSYCHQPASCATCHKDPVLKPQRAAVNRKRKRSLDRG